MRFRINLPQKNTNLDTTQSHASVSQSTDIHEQGQSVPQGSSWLNALQQVLPIYIATHLAFLIVTYFATLFTLSNFSNNFLRVSSLLNSWNRWDSGQYTAIATNGYEKHWQTAFFPLFPILEKGLSFLTNNPFVAGLIISNIVGLGMLTVLYRLVERDFNTEQAYRTTLYLSVFPTAFFFAAAYNEALFLFLALLSFYCMRQGNWWLAALFGFFTALTRSAGLVLLLPFCFEYVHQHKSQARRIMRFDILAGALIPAGLGIYSLYCYFQYQDALAFSHAQSTWGRHFGTPWQGFMASVTIIFHNKILSFTSIHNVLDLSASLVILALLVLGFVGPWKFSRNQMSYNLYAISLYILFSIVSSSGLTPLASFSRFMLEVFPAFIVLAAIGKNSQFNLYYLAISLSLLAFMLLQFLSGHWIV